MKNVFLPVSKSLYIRKLICDFEKFRRLDGIRDDYPEDVRILHDCLRRIQRAESECNSGAEPVCIDVRDCGAAYRFLMALLAVTPGQWLLTGTPHLLQRPIDELVQVLRSIGAEIQYCSGRDTRVCVSMEMSDWDYWFIRGKNLRASELTIDCTRSGQFASALWLVSEKIGLNKLHVLPENSPSASYITMTKAVMDGKADLEPLHLGDWSAAVYWYARLLLEGQMHHSNRSRCSTGIASVDAPESYKLLHLDMASVQSDAVVAHWFADWGIESRQEEDGVVISYQGLNEEMEMIELNMNQNLDLVPVMACMACLWPKKVIFNGVANLRYKESNRLQIIQEQLSPFAKIEIKSYNGIVDNQLVIDPVCRRDMPRCVSTNGNCLNIPPEIFSFNAHKDHRFVMGFSLFALRGKVQIKDFDCVRKSYPDFKAESVVAGTDIVG